MATTSPFRDTGNQNLWKSISLESAVSAEALGAPVVQSGTELSHGIRTTLFS
jgi:hypothetical protein